jgi:hypothetical protein
VKQTGDMKCAFMALCLRAGSEEIGFGFGE